MKSAVIAYSGGVDSTFLVKASSMAGMDRVLAVTASSETLTQEELLSAGETASALNIEHRIIFTEELSNKSFSDNPPDRCYYCKKELFGKLKDIAANNNFSFVIDGTNADDLMDHRPGRRAAAEMGVLSPLLDAGMTKNDIRELSRRQAGA
ncbi:MAG: ATP-dependent sacrificial sulfur transferase LarE [Nitrospirae bacterium]|nr:ATP-dependent sacrificial sulfur transferase LarE [Nitrospirota bacterium]